MLYGASYEGRQRECGNCGHFTNVHSLCDVCDAPVCERCKDGHGCASCELDHDPPCTCIQTDVDLFDPCGCEFHDSSSAWNAGRRAVTMSERYERYGRIRTSYVYPPIPTRQFDWCAWVDGHEEGSVGYGATEAEAIANLNEQLEEAA